MYQCHSIYLDFLKHLIPLNVVDNLFSTYMNYFMMKKSLSFFCIVTRLQNNIDSCLEIKYMYPFSNVIHRYKVCLNSIHHQHYLDRFNNILFGKTNLISYMYIKLIIHVSIFSFKKNFWGLLHIRTCNYERLQSICSGPHFTNLPSATNYSFHYKLVKSLLLIGYQQIFH